MPRFCIEGVWYEKATYKEASAEHREKKALELAEGLKQSVASRKAAPSVVVPKVVVPSVVVPSAPSPRADASVVPRAPSPRPPSPRVDVGVDRLPKVAIASDMSCFRGEKAQWWPAPEVRLIWGMTIREPWRCNSMADRWATLQQDIMKNAGGSVADYAQYLRAEGRAYALATARSVDGSFSFEYNYEIEIKGARTFYWKKGGLGKPPTIGDPANFANAGQVDADYIVLNADTIAASTILGFGHKTGTYEVTFFHDMPLAHVVKVNGEPVKDLALKKPGDLSFQEKIDLRKLMR